MAHIRLFLSWQLVQGIIDTYIPNGTYQTLSILAIGLLIAYVFNSIFSYGQRASYLMF